MIELLKNLIRIESISGNEAQLVSFFTSWLSDASPVTPRVDGNNIILECTGRSFDPERDPTLLLCSHIDTVPLCHGWTKDPFSGHEEDGKIFGLGANDALASVVSMTFAALETYKTITRGRLILALVCEEEKGSRGFFSLEPKLPRYTYAIFGEPTSLRIGYCMRGSMKLKMITRGVSCHASRPYEGENAIFRLIDDLTKIRNLPLKDSSPWGTATVEPTTISGGVSENQIPNRIETFLDCRPTSEVHNDKIIELIKGAGIEFEVVRNIRKAMSCDLHSPLIAALQTACPTAALYPFGGSCDMAFSQAPSVVFGPGASERSHSADEFILIDELVEGKNAYASIISKLLGSSL